LEILANRVENTAWENSNGLVVGRRMLAFLSTVRELWPIGNGDRFLEELTRYRYESQFAGEQSKL